MIALCGIVIMIIGWLGIGDPAEARYYVLLGAILVFRGD